MIDKMLRAYEEQTNRYLFLCGYSGIPRPPIAIATGFDDDEVERRLVIGQIVSAMLFSFSN